MPSPFRRRKSVAPTLAPTLLPVEFQFQQPCLPSLPTPPSRVMPPARVSLAPIPPTPSAGLFLPTPALGGGRLHPGLQQFNGGREYHDQRDDQPLPSPWENNELMAFHNMELPSVPDGRPRVSVAVGQRMVAGQGIPQFPTSRIAHAHQPQPGGSRIATSSARPRQRPISELITSPHARTVPVNARSTARYSLVDLPVAQTAITVQPASPNRPPPHLDRRGSRVKPNMPQRLADGTDGAQGWVGGQRNGAVPPSDSARRGALAAVGIAPMDVSSLKLGAVSDTVSSIPRSPRSPNVSRILAAPGRGLPGSRLAASPGTSNQSRIPRSGNSSLAFQGGTFGVRSGGAAIRRHLPQTPPRAQDARAGLPTPITSAKRQSATSRPPQSPSPLLPIRHQGTRTASPLLHSLYGLKHTTNGHAAGIDDIPRLRGGGGSGGGIGGSRPLPVLGHHGNAVHFGTQHRPLPLPVAGTSQEIEVRVDHSYGAHVDHFEPQAEVYNGVGPSEHDLPPSPRAHIDHYNNAFENPRLDTLTPTHQMSPSRPRPTPDLGLRPGEVLKSSSTFYCRKMIARHAQEHDPAGHIHGSSGSDAYDQGDTIAHVRPTSMYVTPSDLGGKSYAPIPFPNNDSSPFRNDADRGRTVDRSSLRPGGPRSSRPRPLSYGMQATYTSSAYSEASGSTDTRRDSLACPALSRRAAISRHSGSGHAWENDRQQYSQSSNRAHRASLLAASPPLSQRRDSGYSDQFVPNAQLTDSPPEQSNPGSRRGSVPVHYAYPTAPPDDVEMTLKWVPDPEAQCGVNRPDSARSAWLRMEQTLGRRVNSALDTERGQWVMCPSPRQDASPGQSSKVRSPGEFTISDYYMFGGEEGNGDADVNATPRPWTRTPLAFPTQNPSPLPRSSPLNLALAQAEPMIPVAQACPPPAAPASTTPKTPRARPKGPSTRKAQGSYDMSRGSTLNSTVYAPSTVPDSDVTSDQLDLAAYHFDDALFPIFPFAPADTLAEETSGTSPLRILREKTRKYKGPDAGIGYIANKDAKRPKEGLVRLDTHIARVRRSFQQPSSAVESPEDEVEAMRRGTLDSAVEDESEVEKNEGKTQKWKFTIRSLSPAARRKSPVASDREPIVLDTPSSSAFLRTPSPPSPHLITPPAVLRSRPLPLPTPPAQVPLVAPPPICPTPQGSPFPRHGLGLGVPIQLKSTYALYDSAPHDPPGQDITRSPRLHTQLQADSPTYAAPPIPSPQPRSPRAWSVLPGLEDLEPMDEVDQMLLVRDLDTGVACQVAMTHVEATLAVMGGR